MHCYHHYNAHSYRNIIIIIYIYITSFFSKVINRKNSVNPDLKSISNWTYQWNIISNWAYQWHIISNWTYQWNMQFNPDPQSLYTNSRKPNTAFYC